MPTMTVEGMEETKMEVAEQSLFQLRQYADKVTKELARYQSIHGPLSKYPVLDKENIVVPPWATNMNLMTPLIRVYEERIQELEAITTKSYGLAEQAQALSNENELLREELAKKVEELSRHQQRDFLGGGKDDKGGLFPLAKNRAEEERDEINSLYKLSIEQNEVLAQQNVLLKGQVEKMQNLVTLAGDKALEDEQKKTEITQNTQKIVERMQDKERIQKSLEAEIQKLTTQLISTGEKLDTREKELETLKGNLRMTESSMKSLKESCTERVGRFEEENQELSKQVIELEEEINEKRLMNVTLERENVELGEKYRTAKKNLEANMTESTNMLQMMEVLERKEKATKAMLTDVKSRLEIAEKDLSECLLEKSKLEALESTRAESEQTFEAKLKGDVDKLLSSVSQASEGQLEKRQRRIDELESQVAQSTQLCQDLQNRYDFLVRQRAHDSSSWDTRSSLLKAENDDLKRSLSELQSKRLELEKEVDITKNELQKTRGTLQVTTEESKSKIRNESEKANILSNSLDDYKRKIQTKEEVVVSVEKQNQSLQRSVVALQKETKDIRAQTALQLEAERRKWDSEREELLSRLRTMAAKSREGENRALELMKIQETLRERWTEDLQSDKLQLEQQVEKLKKQCLQLKMGNVMKLGSGYGGGPSALGPSALLNTSGAAG